MKRSTSLRPTTRPSRRSSSRRASEPQVGELSYFRVVSGSVANGAEVKNGERGKRGKLNHLSIALGKERAEVTRLHAGDIGVVAKLKNSHTNDTLTDPSRPVVLEKIDLPQPDIAIAIRGTARHDEDKLGEVLPKLHEEDPTFVAEFNPELGQTIARGLGELHLDVQIERMKRKYGVSVETEQPKIPYRETITKGAQGQGRHKKQSGWPRPVRRLLDPPEAPPQGRGLRVQELHQGGGHPHEVRPQRGQGHQGSGRARGAGGLPRGGLRGGVLRRLLPFGRLERYRLQAGQAPPPSRRWAADCSPVDPSSPSPRWP